MPTRARRQRFKCKSLNPNLETNSDLNKSIKKRDKGKQMFAFHSKEQRGLENPKAKSWKSPWQERPGTTDSGSYLLARSTT